VRLDPSDERARMALARDLVDAGRPLEAEHCLRRWPVAPRAGPVRMSRLPGARTSTRSRCGVAAGPFVGQERIHELVGRLRLAEADFDGAIDAFRRRIDASPNTRKPTVCSERRTAGGTSRRGARGVRGDSWWIRPTRRPRRPRAGAPYGPAVTRGAARARRAGTRRQHLGALYALGTATPGWVQAPAGSAAIERSIAAGRGTSATSASGS
jgi:hypothetical protein